jgi:hypothetical protein
VNQLHTCCLHVLSVGASSDGSTADEGIPVLQLLGGSTNVVRGHLVQHTSILARIGRPQVFQSSTILLVYVVGERYCVNSKFEVA